LAVHAYFCDWRFSSFPRQQAIFGLEESPFELPGASSAGGESSAILDKTAGAWRGVAMVDMHYACGLEAAAGMDVPQATLLGVILPLGLLFVAFDQAMSHERRPAEKKDSGFRLSRGHYSAC